MKLHLISDVHAEALTEYERPLPTAKADVCVLAGDICTIYREDKFEAYLRAIKDRFDEVLWVAGNHEFYRSNYDLALERMAALAERTGVRLLDIELGTERFEYKGIRFFGSTLWTDCMNGAAAPHVEYSLNDYRLIGDMTTERSMAIHQRTAEAIDWDADVVITHHCPIVIEHRRFPISDITYGFCNTGLEQQITDSNLKFWLYGHTHDSRYVDLNGTHIVSNQQGYPRQAWQSGTVTYEECHFDPGLILET